VTRLLAGELIKVRTTRTALGFGIAAVVLTVVSVLTLTLGDDPVTIEDKRAALNFGGAVSAVLLILGVVGATGEFRHRTLAPAVLIAPDRFRLVVARVLAYGLTAGLVAMAMGVVAFGLGTPLLSDAGPDMAGSDYLSLAAGGLLATVLCAMLGVGFGTLVRNQVAAVVGLFVWLFVLEPLVPLIDEDLDQYRIGIATSALGQGGDADVSMLTAAAVLIAWAAALCITGALVDRRRDVE
jgi:ABC-2 type transport system permease protein